MNEEYGEAETEVAYHHDKLGKIYYRGYDTSDIINSNLSFLETAYLLVYGEFPNRDIIHKVFNLVSKYGLNIDTIIEVRRLNEKIGLVASIPLLQQRYISKSGKIQDLLAKLYTFKDGVYRDIQNLFILHLDYMVDNSVYSVIRYITSGLTLFEALNLAVNSYANFVSDCIISPLEILLKMSDIGKNIDEIWNELDNDVKEFILSHRSEYKVGYIEDLKKISRQILKSNDLIELYDYAVKLEKYVRKYYNCRGLNLDFYTGLALLDLGFNLSEFYRVLYIARAVGLTAYALEFKDKGIAPTKLIYRGPIGLKLKI